MWITLYFKSNDNPVGGMISSENYDKFLHSLKQINPSLVESSYINVNIEYGAIVIKVTELSGWKIKSE